MAHRKPLGTICRINFENDLWRPMPEIGDWLRSESGTSYLIVGIEDGPKRTNMVCERVAEAGAGRVYEFYWLPRNRRAA